jgi:hypothetical protein
MFNVAQVNSLNLFKMDTVGDAYIVAAWLEQTDTTPEDGGKVCKINVWGGECVGMCVYYTYICIYIYICIYSGWACVCIVYIYIYTCIRRAYIRMYTWFESDKIKCACVCIERREVGREGVRGGHLCRFDGRKCAKAGA